MKLLFRTKEEANKEQEEEFLKLTPVERFYAFLALSERVSKFPSSGEEQKNNFIISITSDGKKLAK